MKTIKKGHPVKPAAHYTHQWLITPTEAISVNLIGAGGSGSAMLTALARIHHTLRGLGHPGFQITVFDDDRVEPHNLGRQLFPESDLGQYKSIAAVNRVNRFFGTAWRSRTDRFGSSDKTDDSLRATITISCIDSVKGRFRIAEILSQYARQNQQYSRDRPLYWMDLGNGRESGQCILSTVGNLTQPKSKTFRPEGTLPFVTDEFAELLRESEETDTTPGCSLAEALRGQDLFINSALVNHAGSFLWSLFATGYTRYRGFFLHLGDFRCQPIPVG